MPTFEVQIDGDLVRWEVSGETSFGADEVLLDRDDDLTRDCPWAERGYAVAKFLSAPDLDALTSGVARILAGIMAQESIAVPPDFELATYHRVVATDDAHARVIAHTRRGFPLDRLPIPIAAIETRVSEILGVDVAVLDRVDVPACFCLRIVRPHAPDNNPPHRDVWLDRLRNAVNIYVPLAASNARSSLPLVPGSHRWKESELERTKAGAVVDRFAYTVPSVVGATRSLRMTRPDPAGDEVLVFSPYLVHGGARNFNADETRVSLEMRFARAPT